MGDSETRASRLGKAWGDAAGRAAASSDDESSRARFLAHVSHSSNSLDALRGAPSLGPRWRPWVALGLGGLMAIGVAAAIAEVRSPPHSTVTTSPEAVLEELHAPDDAPLHTRLLDGARLELGAGSVVRLARDDSSTDALYLDRGALSAELRGVRTVRVGPYAVTATDAHHEYDWEPELRVLKLRVRAGEARVSRGDGTMLLVRPGQRLIANEVLGTHTIELAESSPPRVAPAADTTSSGPTAEPESGDTAPVGTSPAIPAGDLGLAALVARGDFQGAMTTARRIGIARCISTCTDCDLRALADAARYTQHRGVALQALEGLANRPAMAATAAFLLGRYHENGQPAQALRWYNRSLQAAPQGAHAAEALGGKMRTLENLGQTDEAARTAATYLQRHPNGVEARRARLLLVSAGSREAPQGRER